MITGNRVLQLRKGVTTLNEKQFRLLLTNITGCTEESFITLYCGGSDLFTSTECSVVDDFQAAITHWAKHDYRLSDTVITERGEMTVGKLLEHNLLQKTIQTGTELCVEY